MGRIRQGHTEERVAESLARREVYVSRRWRYCSSRASMSAACCWAEIIVVDIVRRDCRSCASG